MNCKEALPGADMSLGRMLVCASNESLHPIAPSYSLSLSSGVGGTS